MSKPENLFKTVISGTGAYLPSKTLTNKDLEKLVDTSDEWITERTGIKTRHLTSNGETNTDLAAEASRQALDTAGWSPKDLDLIIYCTVTPDTVLPAASCILQNKLGCKNIMAMDLSAACSGFVYGLSVAHQFLRTGQSRRALVVGSEVLHKFVNYADRETCILFGDGAGAFTLERRDPDDSCGNILSSYAQVDGSLGDLFTLPAGGSAYPITYEALDKKDNYVRMKGREIFRHAVRTMSACANEALKSADIQASEVDWMVPHQANVRIMEAVAKHFDFPLSKVIINLEHMGNISAATIPVAFNTAVCDGRIKRGQTVLFTAFGAGLTAGSLLLKY